MFFELPEGVPNLVSHPLTIPKLQSIFLLPFRGLASGSAIADDTPTHFPHEALEQDGRSLLSWPALCCKLVPPLLCALFQFLPSSPCAHPAPSSLPGVISVHCFLNLLLVPHLRLWHIHDLSIPNWSDTSCSRTGVREWHTIAIQLNHRESDSSTVIRPSVSVRLSKSRSLCPSRLTLPSVF